MFQRNSLSALPAGQLKFGRVGLSSASLHANGLRGDTSMKKRIDAGVPSVEIISHCVREGNSPGVFAALFVRPDIREDF